MYTYKPFTISSATGALSAFPLQPGIGYNPSCHRICERSVAALTGELNRLGGLPIVEAKRPSPAGATRLFAEAHAFMASHAGPPMRQDHPNDERMSAAAGDGSKSTSDEEALKSAFTHPDLPHPRDFPEAYDKPPLLEEVSDDPTMNELVYLCRIDEIFLPIVQRCRGRLLPKQKKALLALADAYLDENAFLASKLYRALHAFDRLENCALARFVTGTAPLCKKDVQFDLEDFRSICDDEDHVPDELTSIIHLSLTPLIWEYVENVRSRFGYDDGVMHPFIPTIPALARLLDAFDIAVPIAGGGLSLGAMVELLGGETKAIEVHAHDRETPESRFLEPIAPEDIEGKRVLLLDKDTVSGASIREAIRMLAPFKPASVSVYLAYAPSNKIGSNVEAIGELEASGVRIFHPGNVEPAPLLDTFYTLHENLGTELGRLRRAVKRLYDIASEGKEIDQPSAKAIGMKTREQEQLYFALNYLLPGMNEVRKGIIQMLESAVSAHETALAMNAILGTSAFEMQRKLGDLLSAMPTLPLDTAEALARARYLGEGRRLAKAHSVENIHIPHSFTASFNAASAAVDDGYDYALIVGPEGFAYEPIFQDLGIETIALNIPEDDFGGKRTLIAFDDLERLKGKRVLVVEDDVQSGATLNRILEELEEAKPSAFGLYLGSPPAHQQMENIPAAFRKVYATGPQSDAAEQAFLTHLGQREVLLKRYLSRSPFPRRGSTPPPAPRQQTPKDQGSRKG